MSNNKNFSQFRLKYSYGFYILLPMAILLFIFMVLFATPNTDENGCPSDEYISKKNIAIIDITDPLPNTSKANLEQLLRYSSSEQTYNQNSKDSLSIFDWFSSNKKVEKTTFYLLSTTNPSELEPIGSFCRQPSDVLIELTDSKSKIKMSAKKIQDRISNVINSVKGGIATKSQIIQTIATLTSNSTWKKGSTVFLLSDLEEISSDCGNFMRDVPQFKSINSNCAKWIEITKENMTSVDNPSDIKFCEILRDTSKATGLRPFWKEYRHYVTGQKASYEHGCNNE